MSQPQHTHQRVSRRRFVQGTLATAAAAAAFAEFVLSADGQAVLAELGFGSP